MKKCVTTDNPLFNFAMMFIAPILLWIYIFKSFLNGSITLMGDTYALFSMFKFFYNNLFNGVIPIWDPFVVLGVPNIFIATSGVLSPLMAVFASLHFLGVDYYASFILFILFFFILGLAGFYLLVLEILGDRFLAWVAFIALLFSGMGPMLFNQLFIYFLFCPAVWMFYFILRFSRTFEVKYFVGIIVTTINMLCFYLPFFFFTVFLFFIIFSLFIYPARLIEFLKGLKQFILKHKKIFLGGVLVVVFALIPLLFTKVYQWQDLLFFCRLEPSEKIVLSEDALNKSSSSAMSFNEVSLGGTFGERIKGGRIFSHLDKYDYAIDDFFYIPVFVYILILITAFVSFRRKQLLILCMGLSVFLLSLGQLTPLHKFLFEIIFYFKYFRNFFFFMAYLIPILIIFAIYQLKQLLQAAQLGQNRWQNVIINTFLHLCFLGLLIGQGNILFTTYLTVFMSCILFNILFLKPNSFRIFIFLIMVLEPIQVFASYESSSLVFNFSAPSKHYIPLFNYQRLSSKVADPYSLYSGKSTRGVLWYDLVLQDSKGNIPPRPFVVTRFTYLLSKTINENVFLNYIAHKFYIYDQVKFQNQFSNLDMERLLSKNLDQVYLDEPLQEGMTLGAKGIAASALAISKDSDQFKVIHFDTNHIQLVTNFEANKFLVYTDSFEKHWKVFVNHHEQKLYRANMAFKGVWLPAGHNEVDFKFSIPGQKEVYLSSLILDCLLFVYLIGLLCLK